MLKACLASTTRNKDMQDLSSPRNVRNQDLQNCMATKHGYSTATLIRTATPANRLPESLGESREGGL